MRKRRTGAKAGRKQDRGGWRLAVAVGVLAAPLLLAGCRSDLEKEFRAAAIGNIEAGVRSLAEGLLDGLFTIADPKGPEGVD